MILALDQGTSGSTALLVDVEGHVRARGYAELPQHYQRALVDKYVNGLTFAQMADAQDRSAKAVESTVQRAKQALIEALLRIRTEEQGGAP